MLLAACDDTRRSLPFHRRRGERSPEYFFWLAENIVRARIQVPSKRG